MACEQLVRRKGELEECGQPAAVPAADVPKVMNDTRPFPIQGNRNPKQDPCEIPWWLAELAYEYYADRFGRAQTLERIAERGGFGRDELVGLLRKEI